MLAQLDQLSLFILNNGLLIVCEPLEQFNIFKFFSLPGTPLQAQVLYDRFLGKCPSSLKGFVGSHHIFTPILVMCQYSYYILRHCMLNHFPTIASLLIFNVILVSCFISWIFSDNLPIEDRLTGEIIVTNKRGVTKLIQDFLGSLINATLKANTSLVRNEYISLWYFLFVFIYLSNIIGLIPYTFTLTSSFLITFYIAATYFIGINLIGVYRQKWYFVTIFLPNGALWHLAPFLVLIEVISHCAKVFSLSIRLFANMLAGHALLKILIGFAWSMCIVNPLFISISIIPWGIVTTVLCLETLIAFLQAYVFILLISIYLNDVLSGH